MSLADAELIEDPDDERMFVFTGLRDQQLRQQREAPGGDLHGVFIAEGDLVIQRAVDAGATVVSPLEEMFWGDRYGVVRDPFGHHWSLAETVREVDMNQVLAEMNADG